MANGQWLLMGGEGPEGPLATMLVRDPQTGTTSQLESKLQTARAWHTATLLPDGTVFIFGGLGADKSLVRSAEVFDPVTQTSELVVHSGTSPLPHHTPTLLPPPL